MANCYDIFGNPLNHSFTCTIQTTAMALTKVIRDSDFDAFNFTQFAAIRHTYSALPIVDVAWLWLIPVGTLWTMCAVLALGTMWKARRVGVSEMALSPLTLLFANVEERTTIQETPVSWWQSRDEAHRMAEKMVVRLTVDERKVSFVQGAGKG
jgi:hypothetical protein